MTNPYFHPDSYGTDGERFQQTRDMAIGSFDRDLEPRRTRRTTPLDCNWTPERATAFRQRMIDLGILPPTTKP